MSLLAAIIYCEAGNQSYEGMVAVGAVVMNRVYSSSFPNSISEVIYQSGQFTPASSGVLASALANGVPSTCYDAAVAAMNGENPVGSALYFNTGSGKGIKIGAHQFY
ncbi:MAG: cell wall hydrolase [Lachnospiraceae bacterium]